MPGTHPTTLSAPRLLSRLLVLLAVLAGVQVVALPSASAASCTGAACNYQDPQAAGCTDGQTVASFTYNGADPELAGTLIELRHSAGCDAAWAKGTGGTCLPRDCGVVLQATRGYGAIDEYAFGSVGQEGNWSNMISYRYWVRACFVQFDLSAPEGYTLDGCTGWQ